VRIIYRVFSYICRSPLYISSIADPLIETTIILKFSRTVNKGKDGGKTNPTGCRLEGHSRTCVDFRDPTAVFRIILKAAVEREKAVEDIYVQREFKKLVVTLWVMKDFLNFLGA